MKLRPIDVSRIDPAPYNPRIELKPGEPRYEQLRKSLDEFGLVQPLIWNQRTGHLVAGHQRLAVLTAQGHKQVDVVVVDLPLEREKALNVALNKIAGDWDEPALAKLLDELARSPDLDIETTGFALPEIEKLTARLAAQLSDAEPETTGATGEVTETPITQPGELIELGEHRLMCGDAADRDAYAQLLGDAAAQLLIADPPYGIDYHAERRPNPKQPDASAKKRPRPLRGDAQGHARYRRWLRPILGCLAERLRPGGSYYIWGAHQHLGFIGDALAELELYTSSIITWAKDWAAPGYADYKAQTEHALYGWRRGARRRFHGPRSASTLWQIPRERTDSYLHPTQKPLALIERSVRYSARPWELVLDPFAGSGTTLIAAARLGRRAALLELEPAYCDLIVRRYIALVGTQHVDKSLLERYGKEGAAT